MYTYIYYITFRHVLLNSSVPNNRKKGTNTEETFFCFFFFFLIVLYNALASIVFYGTVRKSHKLRATFYTKILLFYYLVAPYY